MDIKNFIKNSIIYRELLNSERDWEYSFIFLYINIKAKRLYKGCITDGNSLYFTNKKPQRILKQVIHLSQRLYEDEYYFQNHVRDSEKNFRTRYFNDGKKNWFSCDKKQDDIDYLFKIIAKNIQKWWD